MIRRPPRSTRKESSAASDVYKRQKGYGFIEREDKEKDVFVHSSAITEAGLGSLNEGDELTFEVENGEKGPSAVKLQKTS